MDKKSSRLSRGFTLVEIMVVVTLIGILATLAIPSIRRINLQARGAAYVNDGRVFSEAFRRYAQQNGKFPPSQRVGSSFDASGIPPGMEGYLSEEAWTRTTPLGGHYLWDDAFNAPYNAHKGAIMVYPSTMTYADLALVDEWFDDGNIQTGVIQTRWWRGIVYYMVE